MPLLATLLPWLFSALKTPLAQTAIDHVAEKLGISTKTVEGINGFLQGATPEDLLKAKEADQSFQLEMKRLGIQEIYQLEQLEVQDRSSARDREVKTGDNTTRILAGLYTVGYFFILLVAIFYEFPPANKDTLNALFGMLSAAQLSIISYYFGSSKGSADKTDSLITAVKNSGS